MIQTCLFVYILSIEIFKYKLIIVNIYVHILNILLDITADRHTRHSKKSSSGLKKKVLV